MSKRKQILLILAGMAVLLAALGILLAVVLSSDRQQNQPVAEDTVSDGEIASSNVSRVSKFPSVTYVSRPENHIPIDNVSKPIMPDNFEVNSPPPSKDQLQPGAMEEVDYLTYAKPVLSLNDSKIMGTTDDPVSANFLIPHEKGDPNKFHYYNTELVSIEEALEADNLILIWEYNMDDRARLQAPRNFPVQYYRVVDYEPVTVIGMCEQRTGIPRRFAVRDGVIQAVIL